MKTKFKQLTCLAMFLVTTTFFSQATFERLGSLAEKGTSPFIPLSTGQGVSSDGEIITGGSNSEVNEDNNIIEAYRWENGEMVGLGFLSNEIFDSRTFAISADGLTIVGNSRSDNFEGNPEAFLWSGEMVGLGALPEHIASTANATSADGSVVVGTSYIDLGTPEAFRWENGSMVSLGFVENGTSSQAEGISLDGSIILGTSGTSFFEDTQAVFWENGEINLLGVLPGGSNFSFAVSISTDGSTIVGGSHSGELDPGYTEACKWTNGEIEGLGDFSGGAFHSFSVAVSADGSIIGGYGLSDIGYRAFIWSEETGMLNFQQFLEDEYDLVIPDFYLDTVRGINADATVFVGDGVGSSGKIEAWRITLPEPLVLSVNTFSTVTELNLYPNPTTGTVNIETTGIIESIKIYDVIGKQVATPFSFENKTLDISRFSKGVYFTELTINGQSQTYKISKQ